MVPNISLVHRKCLLLASWFELFGGRERLSVPTVTGLNPGQFFFLVLKHHCWVALSLNIISHSATEQWLISAFHIFFSSYSNCGGWLMRNAEFQTILFFIIIAVKYSKLKKTHTHTQKPKPNNTSWRALHKHKHTHTKTQLDE